MQSDTIDNNKHNDSNNNSNIYFNSNSNGVVTFITSSCFERSGMIMEAGGRAPIQRWHIYHGSHLDIVFILKVISSF